MCDKCSNRFDEPIRKRHLLHGGIDLVTPINGVLYRERVVLR